ncbi:MAG: hypothetical protein V4479_14200, partial [Actinomycetota bacterium]
ADSRARRPAGKSDAPGILVPAGGAPHHHVENSGGRGGGAIAAPHSPQKISSCDSVAPQLSQTRALDSPQCQLPAWPESEESVTSEFEITGCSRRVDGTTVGTCVRATRFAAGVTARPHSPQNRAPAGNSVPQYVQITVRPSPLEQLPDTITTE